MASTQQRIPSVVGTLTGSVLMALVTSTTAHAQFTYTDQNRSVSALASAQLPQQELEFVPGCPPPRCAPQGYVWKPQGPAESNFDSGAPADFGPLALDASASVTGTSGRGFAKVTANSELTPNQISIQTRGQVEHFEPEFKSFVNFSPIQWAYGEQGPYARSSANHSITFDLVEATLLAINWDITGSIDGQPVVPIGSFLLRSNIGPEMVYLFSDINPSYSTSVLLPAGQYYLHTSTSMAVSSSGDLAAGAWASNLEITAVPEASTLSYMALGLMFTAWAARRHAKG